MKRMFVVVLLVLSLFVTSSAELSIVWDERYEDIQAGTWKTLQPLANGEFLYFFVRNDSPAQIHALHFDRNGVLHDDSVITDVSWESSSFDACPSVDGGVIAAVRPHDNVLELYMWDAFGNLTNSETISHDGLNLSQILQNPDGSIILGGHWPDLVSLDPQLNVQWYRNSQDPTAGTKDLLRLISGFNVAEKRISDGSWYESYIQFFTSDGRLNELQEFPDFTYDPTPCPFDNTAVYLTNRTSVSYPGRIHKYDYWIRNLPNDPSVREVYQAVEPLNGLPGYLCAGYEYEGTGIVVEVSEGGIVGDPLYVPDSYLYCAAPMMNGNMFIAGRTENPGRIRVLCVSTGTTHTPISGQLWLHDAPRRLSSNGGVLHYRMLIGNDLDDPADVTLKLVLKHIDHPELVAYESVMTLQPHEPVVIPHDQLAIPGGYPAGEYEVTLRLYDENDVLCSSSMQLFTKADAGFGNTLVDDEPADPVRDYALAAIYPNPFNAATTINVTLPQASELSVRVFDIQGRTVATLADGSTKAAGSHAFAFDGSDLSSGIYFVLATVPGQLNEVRKLVLVK